MCVQGHATLGAVDACVLLACGDGDGDALIRRVMDRGRENAVAAERRVRKNIPDTVRAWAIVGGLEPQLRGVMAEVAAMQVFLGGEAGRFGGTHHSSYITLHTSRVTHNASHTSHALCAGEGRGHTAGGGGPQQVLVRQRVVSKRSVFASHMVKSSISDKDQRDELECVTCDV